MPRATQTQRGARPCTHDTMTPTLPTTATRCVGYSEATGRTCDARATCLRSIVVHEQDIALWPNGYPPEVHVKNLLSQPGKPCLHYIHVEAA